MKRTESGNIVGPPPPGPPRALGAEDPLIGELLDVAAPKIDDGLAPLVARRVLSIEAVNAILSIIRIECVRKAPEASKRLEFHRTGTAIATQRQMDRDDESMRLCAVSAGATIALDDDPILPGPTMIIREIDGKEGEPCRE